MLCRAVIRWPAPHGQNGRCARIRPSRAARSIQQVLWPRLQRPISPSWMPSCVSGVPGRVPPPEDLRGCPKCPVWQRVARQVLPIPPGHVHAHGGIDAGGRGAMSRSAQIRRMIPRPSSTGRVHHRGTRAGGLPPFFCKDTRVRHPHTPGTWASPYWPDSEQRTPGFTGPCWDRLQD